MGKTLANACDAVSALSPRLEGEQKKAFGNCLAAVRTSLETAATLPRHAGTPAGLGSACPPALAQWLQDDRLTTLPGHETRGHMPGDLARYLFAGAYAGATGQSPKAASFPAGLATAHRNWESGKFADRFRVQLRDQPCTTVTSHISKDGH